MRRYVVTLVLVGAAGLAACGDDGGGGGTPDSATPDSPSGSAVDVISAADCASLTIAATIATAGTAFTDGDPTVAVGAIVKFAPNGSHDMVSDTGLFDTGEPSATACLRFNEAGSYPYHCSVHPATMMGTVTVNQ